MLDSKYGLKYSMPHSVVHIVDNSMYAGELGVTTAVDPSLYATIVVTGCPMGVDNKIVSITRSDVLNVAFGMNYISSDDIKKYGQSVTYGPSLLSQNVPIKFMRVTPDDATYAFSCILVQWRWDADDKKIHVRFKQSSDVYSNNGLPDGVTLARFKNPARLNAKLVTEFSDDNMTVEGKTGWKQRVFMTYISAGRGSVYNNFNWCINPITQGKRPANVAYLFSTIDTRTNNVVEQFTASLININNGLYTNTIDTVNTVVNRRVDGSDVLIPTLNESAVQELYKDYMKNFDDCVNNVYATLTEETKYQQTIYKTLTVNTFDPIFGRYIYTGDGDIQLPYYQVDMFDMDIPRLTEEYRINTTSDDFDNTVPSKLYERVESFYKGITEENPDDSVVTHIGDLYLTNRTTPTIAMVSGINQYTGAISTITLNKARKRVKASESSNEFKDEESTITCVITFDTSNATGSTDEDKIKNAIYNQIDVTIAKLTKLVPTSESDYDYIIAVDESRFGSTSTCYLVEVHYKLEGSTYKCDTEKTRIFNDNNDIRARLVFPSSNMSLLAKTPTQTAWSRAGATIIDVNGEFTESPVKASSTDYPEGSGKVYVNKHDVTEEVSTDVNYRYEIPSTIFISSRVPSSVTVQDNVGLAFDVFEKEKEYKDGAKVTRVIVDPDNNNANSLSPNARFLINNKTEINVDKIEDDKVTEVSVVISELDEQINENFVVDKKVYIKCSDTMTYTYDGPLETEPSPFDPTQYYKKSGETYVAGVTGDEWNTNTWYERKEALVDLHSLIDTVSEGLYFVTVTDNKITNDVHSSNDFESTDTVAEVTLTDENITKFNFAYTPKSKTDTTTDAPFKVYVLSIEKEKDTEDPKSIHRYSIKGTMGSLYYITEDKLNIPNNYYNTESYGINPRSELGGIPMENGYTGFFDENISDIEFKWMYSELLVKAFKGEIDPRIMSPTRVPAKYLFDGGFNTIIGPTILPYMSYTVTEMINMSTMYDEDEKEAVLLDESLIKNLSDGFIDIDVKQAMYDLMEYRVYQGIPEDKRPIGPGSGLSLHLDSGITDAATALNINQSFAKRFSNPNASWDIGGFVGSDGISYTYTKRLVDNMFTHMKQYSVNKPFTGKYTNIGPSEYISFFPDIDTTDWEMRELLYNSGGNAWVMDINGNLQRKSQRTLYREGDTSDLIQENNMRTLSQLVFLLQNKIDSYLLEYYDDGVLATLKDECDNMFAGWVGNLVQALDITFRRDINPTDGGEIVVCYVNVTFRGLILRVPIIVNVNRRTDSE